MKRLIVEVKPEMRLPDWFPRADSSVAIHGPHRPAQRPKSFFQHFIKPNAWHYLHAYRGCDPEWLAKWERIIPSGRCNCKAGYRDILKDYPPDFSSPEAFFEWGVRLHNAVNQKLIDQGDTTKRIVSLEEAYSIWRGKDASSQDGQKEGSGGSVQAVSGSSDA